jgi:hypothetical protein
MRETGTGGSAVNGSEPGGELVSPERREALVRLAKYSAPAMLALLVTAESAAAAPCVSACRPT